eukprot:1084265-Pelagomonas_calceolata.AAC.2
MLKLLGQHILSGTADTAHLPLLKMATLLTLLTCHYSPTTVDTAHLLPVTTLTCHWVVRMVAHAASALSGPPFAAAAAAAAAEGQRTAGVE